MTETRHRLKTTARHLAPGDRVSFSPHGSTFVVSDRSVWTPYGVILRTDNRAEYILSPSDQLYVTEVAGPTS